MDRQLKYKKYFGSSKGFTLAEILLVITIIGCIASCTIPDLVISVRDQQTVVRVKKGAALAAQAFQLAENDYGPVENWGWIAYNSSQGAQNVLNILSPYLNVVKNCGTSAGCFNHTGSTELTGALIVNVDNDPAYAKAILADGSFFNILTRSGDCTNVRGTIQPLKNICGWFSFDINGFKGPNQVGKDYFGFYITKYGIIPVGTSTEFTYPPADCDINTGRGYACTAYILMNGNMDYLK